MLPLRQSLTTPLSASSGSSSLDRQPSTTSSSASSGYSGYSNASDASLGSFNTQYTYASSGTGSSSKPSHRRGQSDVLARARTFDQAEEMHRSHAERSRRGHSASNSNSTSTAPPTLTTARRSLRPLPQAPAPASGIPASPQHDEAPVTPPRGSWKHERGKSVDIGRLSLSQNDGPSSPVTPPRPLPMRPNSMLLGRSDSVARAISSDGPHGHASRSGHSAHLGRPDLEQLGRSSTSQLKTLSRLAQSDSAEGFTITSPAQEVVGLRGRRRLQRADRPSPRDHKMGYGWEGRNWMDKQRQFLQAYEYLCHIGEAKEWIEDVTHKPLPPIVELEEALRDGVTLAEVVEALNPDRRHRIFRHQKLQFRHSDNIAIFFRYLDEVELPDLFRFELIDLYEKKNIPKVIYCIHALSWLLFRLGIVDFRIGNLVGQLEFEHHELEEMQKDLDKLGANMPAFGNMSVDFGMPEPEPPETEEERTERELRENEAIILDLQSQIRGAVARLRLGATMQQLWDEEHSLIDLQARIRGDFTRQIMGYRLEMRRFATKLQSASRGFIVRRGLRHREAFWSSVEPDILALQSLIRAKRARDEVRCSQDELARCRGPVCELQAVSRGFLARRAQLRQQRQSQQSSGSVCQLQAAVRGTLLRSRVEADRHLLAAQAETVSRLQAAARASLMREQAAREQERLESLSTTWTALQGAARARAARARLQDLRAELRRHSPQAERFQAAARAAAVRRQVTDTLQELQRHESRVTDLQAWARGQLERSRIVEEQQRLRRHEAQVARLQARLRGCLYRKQHRAFTDELESHTAEIVAFQAALRGMVARAEIGDLLSQLEEEEASIVGLQAATRGFIVRARFEEKRRYFNENMQKVVKIQSFVRAKVQGEAYKSLTTGKNPPVSAVKNFVHLLNDSDLDFNEEVEFERMRKTVVQQVRQNEMLEQYIDQLDIKIALLVKNKITLDEVVRHQHNYGSGPMGLLANSSMSSANQFDLKALNKSSRKKLESYQQLFFNLQTQPQYLARLFRSIREQGTAEKECRRIELLMMSLFGYAQKRREEYYLLKLIARSVWEEAEGCQSLSDFTRGNFFWAKLLGNYTRSPRDRKYLRDLLGPLIRDNIVEDPALDLESDPMQIYRAAINNEELRTGRPDPRPLDVPREVAIRDPETRRLFIDHLRDLRELCEQLFSALEDQLHKMPYGLRFLAGEVFASLCRRFPREHGDAVRQVVTGWLWRFYLQPALTNPENVGVMERTLSPLQRRNLGEVGKVMGQIASGRPFGGDNVYLQPLNAFVGDSIGRLGGIVGDLMAVPDAERTFDIDEFNDLYAKNKPTLYIKMADVFAIHALVVAQLQAVCPSRDDLLREIMQDLGSAKSNESEMHAAGSSEIHMSLTPKLHDVDDPDAQVKALFMETKRCVLYIVRVQTGANLLEILVKPVAAGDEQRWQALLRDDFGSTRGAYSDANMADVTRMSYAELKRTALENVMRLEQLGRISKHNFYQDILNAIASDIRTKSRRRVQRQRELDGVRLTLGNLHEKAKYLEQQRKSYDDYIESAMATLQNKKGFVPFRCCFLSLTSVPSPSPPSLLSLLSLQQPPLPPALSEAQNL